ncbi:SMI1/KNR4 family protein [Streptomyces sp. NPDC006997]|uniref:SMI1/KNR4 family protein n=1 Tax=Streptomyces sp. NPDC006997 TaxID=3155356 RepID=UPI003410E239
MDGYLDKVSAMLGEPLRRYERAASWSTLEGALGVNLPADFKKIVDWYAPVLINGHLSLKHPATKRWNLGEWIHRTSDAWSRIGLSPGEVEGDPTISLGTQNLSFGTPDGLIPLTATDRGETLFYALRGNSGSGSLFVENGEGEFFEYSMGFAEWLWRWLVGEEMAGPGSSAFYPGPVALQDLPMAPGERPEIRFGPLRGM